MAGKNFTEKDKGANNALCKIMCDPAKPDEGKDHVHLGRKNVAMWCIDIRI